MEEIVTVRVGKRGVSEGFVRELKRLLKEHKVVKVKVLKNYRDSVEEFNIRDFAKEIAGIANARLIEVRGFTFILKFRGEKG